MSNLAHTLTVRCRSLGKSLSSKSAVHMVKWLLLAGCVALVLVPGLRAQSDDVAPPPDAPASMQKDPRQIDPLMCIDITDETSFDGMQEHESEYLAYSYFFLRARQLPNEVLREKSARDLTFTHLYGSDRQAYRGRLVHLEGRLTILRKYTATQHLMLQGIDHYYEGWLWLPTPARFACVLFSELPEGLSPGEKINRKAEFDGYFFKKYLYESKFDNKGQRRVNYAPLLIGRSITILPPEQSGSFFGQFLGLMATFVALIIVTAVGLSVLFRRGDKRVRAKLASARPANPFDDSGELPTAPRPLP